MSRLLNFFILTLFVISLSSVGMAASSADDELFVEELPSTPTEQYVNEKFMKSVAKYLPDHVYYIQCFFSSVGKEAQVQELGSAIDKYINARKGRFPYRDQKEQVLLEIENVLRRYKDCSHYKR